MQKAQPWNLEPLEPHVSPHVSAIMRVQKCEQFCEQLNRDTLPTGETRETNMSFSSGMTYLKQNKGTRKSMPSLLSRTCWEPQIQIPTRSFQKTFHASGHESSRRCAFQISILSTRSHTCLFFALNTLIRRDGDLQSLWPASSENVLVNLLLLHCGHRLWDWTFPQGSRKQQTYICTD